ncbi:MFS transporter [Streptomyces chumphonensis]|uniref:MFS transporter n=1 Tax=Streptomyces chumphonensis TaxID=1214925 RepID=A0A927IAY0_9ACTN|nr:MFS transporter [Streptomyces chumphonensis]MBD3932293.1 MFS transporter [Streptomyces chumphonensis]
MPSVDTGAPVIPGASQPSSPTTGPAAGPATDRRADAPSTRRVNLALFALGLATFALLFSTQALLPALSADFAVSPDAASWTISAATIALAVCVLPLSMLSERFGRQRLMTVSVAVAVGIALVLPLAPDLGWLVALRTVQGAAIAGIPASAMAYLSEELRPGALVGAIGLFVAGNSVGGMAGRIVTGWVAEGFGWRGALLVVGVMALVCAVVFRALLPRARNFTPSPLEPRALARTVRDLLGNALLVRLYAIGLLFMAVFGAVYTVIGYRLVAEPFGLSQGLVGSVFVIYLVGTGSSAASGGLVKRLGRRGALYLAIGTTAVGLLLTLSGNLVAVLAGLVLVTAGFFAGHTTASSSVSRTVTSGRAQASALYQMAYYVGSSLGGTLGALAFHGGGWAGTVALALTALVGAAGITLYATRRAVRLATA